MIKTLVDNILQEIEIEIDEIDLYGYDIIETSLSMVRKLQTILNDLRTKYRPTYFPLKRTKYYFSRHRNRKYLVGYCSSIKYIALKHNVLMVAMR